MSDREAETAFEAVVVRHGETEWSRESRHTGRTDVPLTERGRDEARHLRRTLSERSYAAVFTSPLQRALETARLAGFDSNLIVDSDLQEWDYGEYEGLTSEEVRAGRPGWVLWRDGCIGGETIEQVARRADRVIERFHAAGGDVLAFAHGHILRVLAARWLQMHPSAGQRFALAPAAPSTLGFEHEWTALRAWNVPTP
jgi:probable phosphoglycerate mutase